MEGSEQIRCGIVSAVLPELHRVRVTFPDKDDMVSYELPVLVRGSAKNKFQALPDVGDAVLCAFLPNGTEQGFVLGAFYNDEDRPETTDADDYRITLPGAGTLITNRRTHVVKFTDYYGSTATFANGDITFQSARNLNLN